ncbi:transposase [Sulfurimonas sp.]|uniref:transposase n=1 Tax=Sulfurimonas sp. TaxID=2022749 RepID=UPI0025CEF5E2|nr:transposase [Sulfurimonas sp.]MDD5157013.1 transposase [Sulfurimonas sp.]
MPTRLRVDLAGYHHIVNRGVNRCDVFNSNEDKEIFLQIINKSAMLYKTTLHDYCLMDNHYHFLIETQKENLSSFMRVVNANYAKYFNKKYKRSGHLWQDRYKSKYITSENYLYSLIRYIENNPLEASMVHKIGAYPYTLSFLIFNAKDYYPCCSDSILIKQFDLKTLNEFLGEPMNDKELQCIKTKEKQKILKEDGILYVKQEKQFQEHFYDISTNSDRNLAILNAYQDGYSQVSIASYLNLSKSLICKVVKSKSGDSLKGV